MFFTSTKLKLCSRSKVEVGSGRRQSLAFYAGLASNQQIFIYCIFQHYWQC